MVRDPAHLVVIDHDRFALDDEPRQRAAWRTILLHKPRAVVTTRHDPNGRRTIYAVLNGLDDDAAAGLDAIGRLDLATTGLLLLTTDTQLANWITDPGPAVAQGRDEIHAAFPLASIDGIRRLRPRVRTAP